MPAGPDPEELLDGIVQFRFSDEANSIYDLNATDVAEVAQGLVEFTSQMAKAGLFGDFFPPQVRMRPPREGSFIVEFLVTWAQENPLVAAGLATGVPAAVTLGVNTAGQAVTQAVTIAARKLRGATATDVDYLDNGNVKVTWDDKTINEVPPKVWQELNAQKKNTKRAMRRLMAPLGEEVNRLEVRGAAVQQSTDDVLDAAPDLVLDRTDYQVAGRRDPDPDDQEMTYDVEARMLNIDFRPGQKWRIEVSQGTRTIERSATMEDAAFQRRLDAGHPLRKSDILRLKINEVLSVTNGRSSRDWTIVEVVSQRQGSSDGDGESPPTSPSA